MVSNMNKKVCLITGAGSGIGRATARRFYNAGYELALLDLDRAKLSEALGSTATEHALCLSADVTSRKAVAAAFSEIDAKFGRLDVLVNSAGISGPVKLFYQLTEEESDRVMEVNFKGTVLCMMEALHRMNQQKSGAIVNLASIYGLVGAAGSSVYCASKHAVVGLTRAVAIENAKRGIRVNAICPGGVDTPLLRTIMEAQPGYEAKISGAHPMGRLSSPEEIANGIFWMASEEASFMTGQTLALDGGYTAG